MVDVVVLLIWLIVIAWGLGMIYGISKRLPKGLGYKGLWHSAELDFIYELSYELDGRRVHKQRILDAMLVEIEQARHFIIVDIFLFNNLRGSSVLADDLASPTARLTDALVAARLARPELPILFISDEINTGYGSYLEPHLARLAAQGVEVVFVDLTKLPDPNPIYSGFWRSLLQWFYPAVFLRLPNVFANGAPGISLASYLRMLNFKANHRKLLITEQAALVASSNIHDASARHSNIALRVRGSGIIADLVESELAVAHFSGHKLTSLTGVVRSTIAKENLESSTHNVKNKNLPQTSTIVAATSAAGSGSGSGSGADHDLYPHPDLVAQGLTMVRLLTENAIRTALIRGISATTKGDRLWVGQFYLTERGVMKALLGAAERGVELKLILDSSGEAFGLKKYGIPNRSTAARLKARGGDKLQIRWYNTKGEQFHTKLILIEYGFAQTNGGRARLIGGSANYTRRNLAGYNLETCLEVYAASDAAVIIEARNFFTRLWFNQDGCYTVDYEKFAEGRPIKAALIAWQEFSGTGTF